MTVQLQEPNRDYGLTLNDYQARALKTDRRPDASLAFPLLGLFGEAGTLLSVVKKKQRDAASYFGYAPHVTEELGDVLWYFAAVAERGGLLLSDVAASLCARDIPDLRFSDLQAPSAGQKQEPTPAFENTLLELAGEIGAVLSDFQAQRLSARDGALKSRLTAVLRALIKASTEAGVTLENAATANLEKVSDRWPLECLYPEPFDKDEENFEQLPRILTVDIVERDVGGSLYVFQQCNGVNIGGRLTDNAIEADDYRFHDVFHYANCAILTWSPVTRALLHLKRKTKPLLDEVEDGARAALIEEGVATWVFNQAKNLKFFAGVKNGELSFDMLKTIRQFVTGYEPEHCPFWLWEEAILQGYHAFRFLQEKRRARVRVDMIRRKLFVEELPSDA